MAAKEVLSLDEIVPQALVPQAGDTYEMPRDVNITGDLTVTGTIPAPPAHNQAWSTITTTPTTMSGYGISDTKANFNTACSDGAFMYTGDAPTSHTHPYTALDAGTAGELITWSNLGAIEAVAVGTATHVLTSNGVGVAPTFQAPAGGGAFGADVDTQITPSTPVLLDHASNNEVALNLAYTTNKAAGNDTGLVINQTDTASPGTSLLQDWQVGGVSKASINNAGAMTIASNFNVIGASEINLNSVCAITGQSNRLNFRSYYGANFLQESDLNFGDIWKFYSNPTREMTATGSIQSYASFSPLVNQSGTAGYNGILVNVTETGLGSGVNNLLDLQVGSVSKASIDNGGNLTAKVINAKAGDEAAGNVGALTSVKSAIATVSSSAAATLTASNLIPAGCFLLGLTARITTGFGNSTGLTDFDVGDGVTQDRFANSLAIASGTTMDITNATVAPGGWFMTANNVVLTAVGGNFDATGVIELIAHYIDLTAPTG